MTTFMNFKNDLVKALLQTPPRRRWDRSSILKLITDCYIEFIEQEFKKEMKGESDAGESTEQPHEIIDKRDYRLGVFGKNSFRIIKRFCKPETIRQSVAS